MSVNAETLSRLFPLDSLRPETLQQLAVESRELLLRKGEAVFEAGSNDDATYYLVEGELRFEYPDGRSVAHLAGTNHGRYALNDAIPRRFTARVHSASAKLIKFDRQYGEKLMVWDQISRDAGARHFDSSAGGNDWIYRLLQRPAFLKLPAGNLERMFAAFEEMKVTAGQVVVQEGEIGDYFYVIRDGAADVAKQLDGVQFTVAHLERGSCFGEDALIANAPRNATVRMSETGRLMRLSKADFEAVLKPPMLNWILPAEAAKRVKQGALLLDVRLVEEFAQRAIDGAINIPLHRIREELPTVTTPERPLLVYCNTGERSAAAAYILKSNGYEVSALHGGLGAMLRTMAAQQAQLEAFQKKF